MTYFIGKRISIIKGGQKVAGDFGERFIEDYVENLQIFESMSSPSIEVRLTLNDYADFAQTLTGTELYKIELSTPISDRTLYVRANGVVNKVPDSKGSQMYTIVCYSEEYLRNESKNIFGHTEVIFGDTSAANIVKTIVRGKDYLNSEKNIFIEESLNKHSITVPNWRPLDVIGYLAERSYRKNEKAAKNKLQSGYVFYENALGFNFHTIDKMIEGVKATRKIDMPTDPKKGTAALYEYTLSPVGLNPESEGIDSEVFRAEGFSILEEGNLFRRMRNGNITGYSVGFDPISLNSSQVGLSSDMPEKAFKYHLNDMWSDMEHLDLNKGGNPISVVDSTIKNYVDTPRRVRYNMLPNKIYDTKNDLNRPNYAEVSLMDTYRSVRISSLKHIQGRLRVKGNLDLYSGRGVKIRIPSIKKEGVGKRYDDPRYSGRYLITSVTHNITGDQMTTICDVCRDSLPI